MIPLPHSVITQHSHPVMPVAMADAKSNVSIVVKAESNLKLESMLQTMSVELGNAVGVAGRPLSGKIFEISLYPIHCPKRGSLGEQCIWRGRTRSPSSRLLAT